MGFFFNRTSTNENIIRQRRISRGIVDWTEGVVVNRDLTYGLYHNEYNGFKLAGSLAYAPIAVPVWFMGLPVAESEDNRVQDMLNDLTEQFSTLMQQIHTECHRDGTIWVWPYFSAEDRKLHWEIIPDTSVTTVMRDIRTGDVSTIICEEQMTISLDNGMTAGVVRKRTFTRDTIKTEWMQSTLRVSLENEIIPNITRELPINFSNNSDATEVRGHSDYERIVYDLKNYHDIELMQTTTLAKFNTKMIVDCKDATAWLKNNGFEDIGDVDIAKSDLFLNLPDEKVTFQFPDNAYQAYESALKRTFRKIVEGSVVPEICWGIKVEGNLASAEEQMGLLLLFVEDKRGQKTAAYKRLFTASVRLMSVASMQSTSPDIEVKWGNLDKLSAKTKAEVFKSFAEGAARLVDGGAATKQQLYELWNNLYPAATIETYEEFEQGLSAMAKHKQFRDADYDLARDEFE